MNSFLSPSVSVEILPEVGTVQRYGCLTLAEYLILGEILDDSIRELLSDPIGGAVLSQSIQDILCAVLLSSRLSAEWTLPNVAANLSKAARSAIATFLLNERSRWGTLTPSAEPTRHYDPIDWEDVFWRLAAAYPGDRRFTEEHFAATPLDVIERAITSLDQRQLVEASTAATPTAIAASVLARPHYKKMPEVEAFNPYSRMLRKQAISRKISVEDAQLFFELAKERKIPSWAAGILDIEELSLRLE
jgi:hypothetical protein